MVRASTARSCSPATPPSPPRRKEYAVSLAAVVAPYLTAIVALQSYLSISFGWAVGTSLRRFRPEPRSAPTDHAFFCRHCSRCVVLRWCVRRAHQSRRDNCNGHLPRLSLAQGPRVHFRPGHGRSLRRRCYLCELRPRHRPLRGWKGYSYRPWHRKPVLSLCGEPDAFDNTQHPIDRISCSWIT